MSSMLKARWWAMAGIVAVASGALGCGDASRTGRSPMYLVVQEMAASAGTDTTLDGKLRSDVVTKGTIYDDLGHASFSLSQKDIGAPGAPTAPSSNNAVTLTRYRVEYVRADGRNSPGVDVPYPFDGAATVTVPPDGTAELNFTLVRVQAKLEAPLKALQGMGGAIAISTIANVTFYGRDQVGNEISATGSIGVTFADWADPD
jgi:hypothetical protein